MLGKHNKQSRVTGAQRTAPSHTTASKSPHKGQKSLARDPSVQPDGNWGGGKKSGTCKMRMMPPLQRFWGEGRS